MSTPSEVENIRFYQMSLDKSQDKPMPLNRHNKTNVDHQSSSYHSRGRNHPTEGHVYMGKEHHDKANMGRNQSIDIKSLSLFWTKTIRTMIKSIGEKTMIIINELIIETDLSKLCPHKKQDAR
jgi:hypothetical protein